MPRGAQGRRPQPVDEAEVEVLEPPIDEQAEQAQFRSGQVPEGELELARSVAKRMGWTPQEEWKRDPARWVDAPAFLENTPRELESLKERNRRTAQAAADAIEDQRRIAREEALREIREAERAGETERADAAQQRLKATEVPPAVDQWVRANPWFNTDPVARAAAQAVSMRMSNAPVTEQLRAAEEEVRRRFPEHFDEVEAREPPTRETRLSDSRRVAPAVQAGTRNGSMQQTREKGFSDIPAGDQASYRRYFQKRFESTGLKPAEAEAKYAASYWRNQG